ncbi:MAG: molybdopterin-dependent oxidoreductase [Planctomycetota bacterium]|nr:molybdopterin-dependent oxidoreductase [Planctomycetota bacterium]
MTPERPDLVEKRLKYIARAKSMKPETVDVAFHGMKPLGTGPTNRHGMPQLPTGQRAVPNWPVLDLGDLPKVSLAAWRLVLGGACENPVTLTWDEFLALGVVADTSDFHCVTTWSRMDNRWKGVRFATLADLAVPRESARFVRTAGYDKMPGTDIPYTTNLPLVRALEPDVLLVHEWEGQPLPVEHGGPCRMITPKLYAWKGAKWIHRIDFLENDEPGFWEVRGYSNSAEPWFDDRYSSRERD